MATSYQRSVEVPSGRTATLLSFPRPRDDVDYEAWLMPPEQPTALEGWIHRVSFAIGPLILAIMGTALSLAIIAG